MDPGYELFDHTADMGVRAWAPTMDLLVPIAASGFYATIGDLVASAERSKPFRFELTGSEPEMLLRDFLTELLILFERDQAMIAAWNYVTFDDLHLSVSAMSTLVDQDRSSYHREVKAITYHELAVRQVAVGFEATFIVDI